MAKVTIIFIRNLPKLTWVKAGMIWNKTKIMDDIYKNVDTSLTEQNFTLRLTQML